MPLDSPVTNCHTFPDPLPLEHTLWTAPNIPNMIA